MSHVTGSVQTVSPIANLGSDFGPATGPSNTWTLSFNPPPSPAPGGTKLLILHFTGASLPAANRLEVDLGYDTDTFTPLMAPISGRAPSTSIPWVARCPSATLLMARLPAAFSSTSTAGESGTPASRTPRLFELRTPFQGDASYTEPKYDPFWFCSTPPNWENVGCISPPGDIRNTIEPAIGMVMHVDFDKNLGFNVLLAA